MVGGKLTDLNFRKYFYLALPNYLAIGMTPKEFWEESLDLSEAYIKAEYKKRENDDAMCWLQGAYIYQALSVVIGNAFCKGHNKYPDKPNGIKPISKEDEEIRLRNKGIKYLQEISKRNKNRGK